MVHHRKTSTIEVRGSKRFFYTQSGVRFWFWPLFGKMIAAPPGSCTLRAKIFIWANSVIIHSLKNMFKVPGGIRWQFFPVKMRSDFTYITELMCTHNTKLVMWLELSLSLIFLVIPNLFLLLRPTNGSFWYQRVVRPSFLFINN